MLVNKEEVYAEVAEELGEDIRLVREICRHKASVIETTIKKGEDKVIIEPYMGKFRNWKTLRDKKK